MVQFPLIREIDIEPLARSVCDVLRDVGLLCQNDELLSALGAAGARTDRAAQRAWFPPEMVREFVRDLRKEFGGRRESPAGFPEPREPGLGMQIAQLYYDYPTRESRSANSRDLVQMIKLAGVLHPERPAGHCMVAADKPGRTEALEAALLLAEYAHTPGPAFAWYVDQVDYLEEMGEVLGIKNWYGWGAVCFAHPLRFDKAVVDKFVRRVRSGVSTGLTAMPVAGCSTPATVEGFVSVAAAEHIATWLAARVLNPDVPLHGSMWAGSVDPAGGTVSYSSFDAMHCAFAAVEFLRRWTGVVVSVGGGEYCDARLPGMAAVYEKAYKAMTVAAFTGELPPIGEGMLECGKMLAPVQLMIERDFARGSEILGRPVCPSEARIGLSSIREVGLGIELNHMMTEHTLSHFRSSLWLPELIGRSGRYDAEGDREMLNRAQARIDECLSRYQKPTGREDQLEKLRSIVARARPKLLGEDCRR